MQQDPGNCYQYRYHAANSIAHWLNLIINGLAATRKISDPVGAL